MPIGIAAYSRLRSQKLKSNSWAAVKKETGRSGRRNLGGNVPRMKLWDQASACSIGKNGKPRPSATAL